MSRPRRFGPARSLRLPTEADDAIVARAASAGQMVSVWMRDRLLEVIDWKPGSKTLEPATPPAPKPDVAKRAAGEGVQERADERAALKDCEHPNRKFNGTAWVCPDCHKVVAK